MTITIEFLWRHTVVTSEALAKEYQQAPFLYLGVSSDSFRAGQCVYVT